MSQSKEMWNFLYTLGLSYVLLFISSFILWMHFHLFNNLLVFYTGIIIAFLSTAIVLLRVDEKHYGHGLLAIVGFVVIFHLMNGGILQDSSGRMGILGTNPARELQLSLIISKEGLWKPGMGIERMEYFSYYPFLYFWGAIFHGISGIPFVIINILFRFISSVVPIVLYFFSIYNLTEDKNLSLWSTFILTLNEQILFTDSLYTYESLALMFYLVVLYSIIKSHSIRGLKSCMILGLTALTFTNFWTSLNFLFLLTLIYIIFVLKQKEIGKVKRILNIRSSTVILAYLLFSAYCIFVAFVIFTRYGNLLIEVFSNIVFPVEKYEYHAFLGYELYEKILVYAGPLVLAAYGFVGLFKSLRKHSLNFFDWLFLSGGTYLAVIVFALPISVPKDIAHRGWVFSFIMMAPTMARGFLSLNKKMQYIRTASLMIPLLGAVLVVGHQIYLPASSRINTFAYQSATWAQHHMQVGARAIAMPIINDVISPYGLLQDVGRLIAGQKYYEKTMLAIYKGNVSNLMIEHRCKYLFIDEDFNQTVKENPWFLWAFKLILEASNMSSGDISRNAYRRINVDSYLSKIYDNSVTCTYTLNGYVER